MKIEILNYTKKPLTQIGTVASICYNTKLKDDKHASRIAKSCINDGHGRNMEFADLTISVSGVSARMMRECFRHQVGTSFLQASTRYITYDNFDYIKPNMNKEQEEIYDNCKNNIKESYKQLKDLNTENDKTGYILPLCMDTTVIIKMNVRALEHYASMRMCNRALLEFRQFMNVLKKEILNLNDDEWTWIAENLMLPKCKKQLYCDEGRGCGLMPSKKEVLNLLKTNNIIKD